jgi:hypothetical protein
MTKSISWLRAAQARFTRAKIASRASQSSHEKPVLPLDRHVEFLDC